RGKATEAKQQTASGKDRYSPTRSATSTSHSALQTARQPPPFTAPDVRCRASVFHPALRITWKVPKIPKKQNGASKKRRSSRGYTECVKYSCPSPPLLTLNSRGAHTSPRHPGYTALSGLSTPRAAS